MVNIQVKVIFLQYRLLGVSVGDIYTFTILCMYKCMYVPQGQKELKESEGDR